MTARAGLLYCLRLHGTTTQRQKQNAREQPRGREQQGILSQKLSRPGADQVSSVSLAAVWPGTRTQPLWTLGNKHVYEVHVRIFDKPSHHKVCNIATSLLLVKTGVLNSALHIPNQIDSVHTKKERSKHTVWTYLKQWGKHTVWTYLIMKLRFKSWPCLLASVHRRVQT